jgi:hypothetical protein
MLKIIESKEDILVVVRKTTKTLNCIEVLHYRILRV